MALLAELFAGSHTSALRKMRVRCSPLGRSDVESGGAQMESDACRFSVLTAPEDGRTPVTSQPAVTEKL